MPSAVCTAQHSAQSVTLPGARLTTVANRERNSIRPFDALPINRWSRSDVVQHQRRRTQRCMPRVRGRQPLSPRRLRVRGQPSPERRVRHRHDARFGQHTQRVQLAGRLLRSAPAPTVETCHRRRSRRRSRASRRRGTTRPTDARPRGNDLQRTPPSRRGDHLAQVEIQHRLPGCEPLRRGRLQRRQLRLVMR
jgi:hypothetical protein